MIHPEQCRDEFFITNSTDNDYHDIGWKTKRKGTVAYDSKWYPISSINGLFPIFATKEEIRVTDIKVYESLLKKQYSEDTEFLGRL